jgi:hypothetical protein
MKTKQIKVTVGIYFLLILTVALILGSCSSGKKYVECDAYSWEDSIENPDNAEFLIEVAFNEGVAPEEVTQVMFNQRYSY